MLRYIFGQQHFFKKVLFVFFLFSPISFSALHCVSGSCILSNSFLFQGEEVTFDYNYVRVFGAAAKKCYCGSFQCRGYIGGDPLNSEVIIQSDSDEEFPEPVMLRADGRSWNNNLPTAVSSVDVAKMQPSEHIKGIRDKRDQPIRIATEPKISEEKVDTLKLAL